MTIERVRAIIDAATCGFEEPHEAHLYVVAEGDRPTDKACPGVPDLTHDLMPELLALWEAAMAVADFDWSMWERGDIGTVVMRKSDVALFLALLDRQRAALVALDAKAKEVLG